MQLFFFFLETLSHRSFPRECVKRYIAKDFWKLSQSSSFKEARMQDVVFFSNSESIRGALISLSNSQDVSAESDAELKLYKAVLAWLMHKLDERQQHLTKIMGTIKFQVIKVSWEEFF